MSEVTKKCKRFFRAFIVWGQRVQYVKKKNSSKKCDFGNAAYITAVSEEIMISNAKERL